MNSSNYEYSYLKYVKKKKIVFFWLGGGEVGGGGAGLELLNYFYKESKSLKKKK